MKKKHKRKYTRRGTYTHNRLVELPAQYQKGFLSTINKRTKLFYALSESYNKVISDLGGTDSLSRLELSLCERFVFVEMLIRNLEVKGMNGDEDDYLDKYSKLCNSLNSIISKLGISKRETGQSDVRKHLSEKYGEDRDQE